jgi:uncharacterized membrane protein
MWFVGLFLGLLLGNIFGGGSEMFWGGLFGAAAGALISYFRSQSRQPNIEARLAALEAAVRELRQNVPQAPGTPMPAGVVRGAPASAPATPETPYIIPELVTEERAPVPDQPTSMEGVAPTATGSAAPEFKTDEPLSSRPAEPSYVDRAWNWLTGGNALVRVGVVVLFFGVAFLLKYAYEHTHVPIEVRLIGVALGAAVMLAIGWCLRNRRVAAWDFSISRCSARSACSI